MDADVPAIFARNINHWFGTEPNRKQCLFDVSVKLMPGELVVMTGPSGSGKTTLLTLIGGLRSLQEGSLRVLDQELRGLTQVELTQLRQNIGFIFQAHNLFEALTAFRNVRLALELRPLPAAAIDEQVEEILTRLGLGERLHYKPQALSGGQRQRVAIARALVHRPRLILADEPTAALDKDSGREVVQILKQFAVRDRCTILLVTHDSRLLDAADRIVNLIDGRIASEFLIEEAVTIIEFLRRCPVFSAGTPALLADISQKMVREHYPAGAAVIRQGDKGEKFYVIREGTVQVRREDAGILQPLATLSAGEFFGEAALITGEPRNASVVAQQDVVVYSLQKNDFQEALQGSPSFGDQLRHVFFKRQ